MLSGYGTPGATPMLPSQPYYDSSVTARPYDLSQARHYLELAGYSPPSGTVVGAVNLAGTYNDSSGAPKPNATVYLMQTTDNSTFPTSLQAVSHTTTDINGFYSFTDTPSTAGTYYYYLLDNSTSTPQYTYLQSYTVAAASPFNLTVELAIAIVAVVVIIVVVAIVARRRRKPKK
ncbi:MAG: hypothetical protein NT043_05725 [Candidatus Bathyarchaeota archaeon]|nr:hypothetical protein [Candidatus Bathyarchaeota archaeon]